MDNEILRYLEEHGIQNKDAAPVKRVVKKSAIVQKAGKRIRLVIDLHGKTQEKAAIIVRNAFDACRHKGIDTLLIIHGIGYKSDPSEGPVLKKMVMAMLENELQSRVKDFKTAPSKDGGEGATVVRLR